MTGEVRARRSDIEGIEYSAEYEHGEKRREIIRIAAAEIRLSALLFRKNMLSASVYEPVISI